MPDHATPPALQRSAHLWLALPHALAPPDRLESCCRVLSAAEQARSKRFRRARDRHLYVVAHALVRHALSCYAPVPPEAWLFDEGPQGRPEVAGPPNRPALRFNLSHTVGLVACLVTGPMDCGVDVESLERGGDLLAIAERHFSRAEVAVLRRMRPAAKQRRFFTYWTLKEAYLKARGTGLGLPPRQVAFRLDRRGEVHVRFGRELADRAADWQFVSLKPTAEHAAAVALHSAGRPRIELCTRFVDSLSPSGFALAGRGG